MASKAKNDQALADLERETRMSEWEWAAEFEGRFDYP